jgi:hypothetical protein
VEIAFLAGGTVLPTIDNKRRCTFEDEGTPGHISLETMKFAGRDGKTDVIEEIVFSPSRVATD